MKARVPAAKGNQRMMRMMFLEPRQMKHVYSCTGSYCLLAKGRFISLLGLGHPPRVHSVGIGTPSRKGTESEESPVVSRPPWPFKPLELCEGDSGMSRVRGAVLSSHSFSSSLCT